MSRSIRFGIVSFAHYHADFWAEAIKAEADASLAGVWDDVAERGREAADRYGTRFCQTLSGLLRDCDAVGITSTTASHADLVEEAAAAGVHILLEKPIATTLEDCSRIEQAVRRAGIQFMQNFPKRFDPVNRELVQTVRRGDLGKITLVRVRHGHFHGTDPHFQRQWFADATLSGGGTLIDEGVHTTDFLRWLLGETAERVIATLSDQALGLAVEDTACAVYTFPSGALATVTTSWTFQASEVSVEVYGIEGSALLSGVDLASRDFAGAPYLKVFRRGQKRGIWSESQIVPGFKGGPLFHQQGLKHFLECLRQGHRPVTGLEDGRQSLTMVLAAYRAARSGRQEYVVPDTRQ